jgi:hypothetical protein
LSFATLIAAPIATLSISAISAADEKTATPFSGKDLEGWQFKNPKERSKWTVGKATMDAKNQGQLVVEKPADAKEAELVNAQKGGVDIYTAEKFADCTIELEFMVPKGSNSGIYVHGEYEVQILDSYGKQKVGPGDVGGLYGAAAPKTNAAKAPGEWQKFVIEFQAPKFTDGKKTANAKFLKITLNDTVIHEYVEMKGPTPSGVTGKEAPTGPLMFQGDHGPVAFRNIRITTK